MKVYGLFHPPYFARTGGAFMDFDIDDLIFGDADPGPSGR
jgi:hypothetical protein